VFSHRNVCLQLNEIGAKEERECEKAMRIAQKITLAIAIALQVVLVFGCASRVPPTVTRAPTIPLKENPKIYLQVIGHKARGAESLRNAGVRLTESNAEADYILNVNVGERRGRRDCGIVNNIEYILYDNGRDLMAIKGRGLRGTCVPNIFDDMSQKLATYFGV
jgi:hypothetical protein